jgi:hypothetical protein
MRGNRARLRAEAATRRTTAVEPAWLAEGESPVLVTPSPPVRARRGKGEIDPTSDWRSLAPASSIRPKVLLRTSVSVVAAHGAGLVQTTPARPVQHRVWWGEHAHDQAVDEPTYLGDGERNQAVVGGHLGASASL